MEYIFNTRLRGNIALTDSYHTNLALQKDNTLYKFIWVQSGSLQLEIDHVPTTLVKGEIIPLTPLCGYAASLPKNPIQPFYDLRITFSVTDHSRTN